MHILIWPGAAVAIIGILGIIFAALSVVKARRGQSDEATMRATMQRAMAINLGAFLFAALGLMAVIVGVILG